MLRILVFDENRIRLSCAWKGSLQLRPCRCSPSAGQRCEADLRAAKPSLISETSLRLMRVADTCWPGSPTQVPGWVTPTPKCVRSWKTWHVMSLGSRVSQLEFGNDCTWRIVLNAGIPRWTDCAAWSAQCYLLLGDRVDVAQYRAEDKLILSV